MIHNNLHLGVVTFQFEVIVVTNTCTFIFYTWICGTSMAPWIDERPHDFLNPSMISIKWFPFGHLTWFFIIKFTTHMNSCKTKWMVDFLIIKNSKQCKYSNACTNLFKVQVTKIPMGIMEWNLMFFSMKGFNFCQMLHKSSITTKMLHPLVITKKKIPISWPSLNLILQFSTPQQIIHIGDLGRCKIITLSIVSNCLIHGKIKHDIQFICLVAKHNHVMCLQKQL